MSTKWTLGGYHRGGVLKVMRGQEMVAEIPNISDQDAVAARIIAASEKCRVESSFCALRSLSQGAAQ